MKLDFHDEPCCTHCFVLNIAIFVSFVFFVAAGILIVVTWCFVCSSGPKDRCFEL